MLPPRHPRVLARVTRWQLILFRTLFLLYLTVNWNALKLRNETDFIAFSIKHFNIRLIFRYALLLDGLFRYLYDLSHF